MVISDRLSMVTFSTQKKTDTHVREEIEMTSCLQPPPRSLSVHPKRHQQHAATIATEVVVVTHFNFLQDVYVFASSDSNRAN
jgi:hypothetical protein